MPGLIDESLRIIAGVSHRKSVFSGVFFQPDECRRCLELLRQRPGAGRRNINCPSRMVLTKPGRRVDRQNFAERLTRIQLFSDQAGLVLNTPEPGDDQNRDASLSCGCLHLLPTGGRARGQALHSPHQIRPNIDQIRRFRECRPVAATPVITRNAEFCVQFA